MNNKITLTLTHDELVLILLGLANSPEVMDKNLSRARQLFPDLREKLPVYYKEICPEIDHGWNTHSDLYKRIFNAIKEEKACE